MFVTRTSESRVPYPNRATLLYCLARGPQNSGLFPPFDDRDLKVAKRRDEMAAARVDVLVELRLCALQVHIWLLSTHRCYKLVL